MRVLLLTIRADVGGTPEHLYQLLKHRTSDVAAFVACPDDKPYAEVYRELVGSDATITLPHRSFKLSALVALWNVARRFKPNVIHSHGKGAGLYSRILGVILRVPVLHTYHGLHIGTYSSQKLFAYLWLERLLGRLTRAAICVSDGEADQIVDLRILPREKIRVVRNGVEIPKSVAGISWTGGTLHIVTVNRFEFQKNPDLLLEIADRLRGCLDFRIDVLGTGDRFEEIERRIDSMGLSRHVFLHGAVSNPRRYLRDAHVFISTSRWEGLPLAVLEAMSEGRLVLATNVVGNADAVTHDFDGILFRDAEEACDALQSLNEKRWQQLAAEARRTAEARDSVELMCHRTHEVWKEVAR